MIESRQKCSVEGCNVDDDNVCKMHGIIEERRKIESELIKQIPTLLTANKVVLATVSLLLVMILGSYTFTKMTKDEIMGDHALMRASLTATKVELKSQQLSTKADLLSAIYKIYDDNEKLEDEYNQFKIHFTKEFEGHIREYRQRYQNLVEDVEENKNNHKRSFPSLVPDYTKEKKDNKE